MHPLFPLKLKLIYQTARSTLHQRFDTVTLKDHCCFSSPTSIYYTAHLQQQRSGKGQIFYFQMLISFSVSWNRFSGRAPTLLSMAPMMLGPWHCSRLSWLMGWWRIRFFSISRKAAILFLSSLPSENEKKNHGLRFPVLATFKFLHYKAFCRDDHVSRWAMPVLLCCLLNNLILVF